ncbi:AHH domain-containing protein [Myxococcus sp. RHSTA-1-4]|uniref:AHH domain-containing protein n=1 Tax=Myxococcus sp. RHSTA-1-4 TaxID=2874601 RepID=UPI001CBAC16C|nr:AHH domain-containing protein [Myxococcus sp. RHSTA-1-4]
MTVSSSAAAAKVKAPGLPGSVQAVRLAEVQGGLPVHGDRGSGLGGCPRRGSRHHHARSWCAGHGGTRGERRQHGPGGCGRPLAPHRLRQVQHVHQQRGAWTPRYQEIFDREGMSLDDAANQIRVPGHKGPHPRESHEEVYERLDEATSTCKSIERCREALTKILGVLAREVSKQGTKLNRLVTRTE